MKLRLLPARDIREALDMPQAIEAVRKAFIQLSQGKAVLPLRTPLSVEKHEGTILFMPAYLPDSGSLGAKIVSVFPRNPDSGLPTIHAVVILCEAETGRPAAVMDGTYLTALRTGAASGVATDCLARPEAASAAVIGAGIQGRTQLEAVCWVRKIRTAWVYDTRKEAAVLFARELRATGGPFPDDIRVAESSREAVADADIVCTATTSKVPVFRDACLKEGAHVNGIGSFTPDMQEIPEETVSRARVFVDSKAACLEEAGDLILPLKKGMITEAHIQGEIGEVASGNLPGRVSDQEITFFKSVGLAVQDMAVAGEILRNAASRGLGMEVEF